MHHLHIRLDNVDPKIEREFLVPSNLRLDRLHQVIQAVMGWEDCHLHEFVVGPIRNGLRFGPKNPEFAGFGEEPQNETRSTLKQIAPDKGDKFRYWYDFGDDWWHSLRVKAVLDSAPVVTPLFCLKARGACPPEDCGGPWGYGQLLTALADPKHEDHASLLDWLGGPFDPDFPDIEGINERLARLARSWKLAPARTVTTLGIGSARGASKPAGKTVRQSVTKPRLAPVSHVLPDPERAYSFINTYQKILLEIAGVAPEDQDASVDDDNAIQRLVDAREQLVSEPAQLERAVARLRERGEALDQEVLESLRDIRLQDWFYLRDTRSHSIFLDAEGHAAYGVLGLIQPLSQLAAGPSVVVRTALVAYKDGIVCDGLMMRLAGIGPNLRRDGSAEVTAARREGRFSSERLFPRKTQEQTA